MSGHCSLKDCWRKCKTKGEFAIWNMRAITKEYYKNKDECSDKIAYLIESYNEMVGDFSDEDGWISVDERLPDETKSYLLYYHDADNKSLKYADTGWFSIEHKAFSVNYAWGYVVTHWQPLPHPPKEAER